LDNTLHVHPLADLIEHELTEDCPCGPRAQREERADGSDGWLLIHSALDGRELAEPDHHA